MAYEVEKLKFKIVPSKHMEANELLKLQKEAFHSDLIKYKDYFLSPAAESLQYFILKMQTSLYYSIFVDGRLAGGICILEQTKDHYYLYRIFLGSEFQNKGLGSKILQQLEKQFFLVKKWSLDTPKDNRRNRHFYEKHGYIKTGEQQITKYLTLIYYEKNL